jgi:hypothetical protein
MRMASLDEARRAKTAVLSMLEHHDAVNGVGVARVDDGYVVKVNLSRPDPDLTLPASVDDVPVTSEVVGEIGKR